MASLLFVCVAIALALQIPYVQTKVVNQLSELLSEKTGFQVTVQGIAINWFDQVTISQLSVLDLDSNHMAHIEQVTVDYQIRSLIDESSIYLDDVAIDSANIFLAKNQLNDSTYSLNINILIRKIKELTSGGNRPPKFIKIGEATIKNSQFAYHNEAKDSIHDRLDFNHFRLSPINAQLTDFVQHRDTVAFYLEQFSSTEQATGLKISELQTKFLISQKQMLFDQLQLRFGESMINDQIALSYDSIRSLSDFNHLVTIEARLTNSVIHTEDLAAFAPSLSGHHQKIEISGNFKGKVSGFTFRDFDISINDSNLVQGKVTMYGLPDFQETFIDLKVTNASVDAHTLGTMLKPKTMAFLSSFGRTQLNGKFIGYINDFVANGVFHTQMGEVISNINLKIPNGIRDALYSGHLEMNDFDLGKFSNSSTFQYVTLNGEIKGKGLHFKSADFELNGQINKIGVKGYEYTNIKTDAHFAEEFFEGSATINDPNLVLYLEGAIDLRDGKDSYKATLDLDTAFLKPLHLSRDEIGIATEAYIDAKGLKIDSISGKGVLKNIQVSYLDKALSLDSISILTTHDGNNRALTIASDLFDTKLEGSYHYTSVVKSLINLLHEYELNLKNDQSLLKAHYDSKDSSSHEQFLINYDIHLKDITPVISLFDENIMVSKNTMLEGTYSNGYTSIISLNTQIDTLRYKNSELYDLNIDISSSKIADSTNVLAMGFITSSSQKINGNISTENLLFESIWDNNHIEYELDIEQKKFNNSTSIAGALDFLSDTTVIHFDQSSINIFDAHWEFNEENKIIISNKNLLFSDFELYNDEQLISVNGSLSKNPDARAVFNFENINIGIVNPIMTKTVSGNLNGFVEIKNYFDIPNIESDISIDSLLVDNFLVGDFYGKTHWREESESLKIKASLHREMRRTVNINGDFYPKEKKEQLDLRANFDQANISVLESFLKKIFTDIRGEASGVFKITGRPNAPIINGTGFIDKGNIKVNYLNTNYSFDGDFAFSGNSIQFTDIKLQDPLGANAALTGNIFHKGFKHMVMDIKSNMSAFQVLNTASTDNELFYGQGFATGDVSFTGPIANMTINATATSAKGTKIYIPIGDTESIVHEDYINFTSFISDSLDTTPIEDETLDLKGLTMNFDLDITPDAYCELIFDIKSGDIIRGRGNGQINLKIDTRGEFNMFGDYILDKGGYNFTLYNIINKEFELLPQSKISWYGDPYQGVLDMAAIYSQITSLSPLVDTTFQSIPAIRRGYPVDVELTLDGPLLSPTIGFDIDIKDYPASIVGNDGNTVYLEDVVTQLENRIDTDEHELNRQVFSLIVLRKFSPPESFNTAGSIGNSVSEFVSNQLSYWVSQVDENLEVDVDLGKLDDEAFNTFQLRLSYTFLNGRLRVTREGGFNNQDQNQDVSALVGDWTVEYMLTPDGKLRAKMYNRTNYNTFNNSALNSTASITTGFSLLHTQDFNSIKELLTSERRKQRKKQKQVKKLTKNAIREED